MSEESAHQRSAGDQPEIAGERQQPGNEAALFGPRVGHDGGVVRRLEEGEADADEQDRDDIDGDTAIDRHAGHHESADGEQRQPDDHGEFGPDAIGDGAGRHAHDRPGSLGHRNAACGTGAAHRIEVHHRAPAAAGDLRAEHGVVELRIVGGQLDPHVLPAGAEFFRHDLRHGGRDVLAHVGLAAGHRDDAVGCDRIPG